MDNSGDINFALNSTESLSVVGNSFAKLLVTLILSELFVYSFKFNLHISSVINECMCMVY